MCIVPIEGVMPFPTQTAAVVSVILVILEHKVSVLTLRSVHIHVRVTSIYLFSFQCTLELHLGLEPPFKAP